MTITRITRQCISTLKTNTAKEKNMAKALTLDWKKIDETRNYL